jgi:hypothetical protein
MPLIEYKCAKCKMRCDSYEEAEKCEQTHLPACTVREIEYRLGAYPFRVIIAFPDGQEREYVKQD